MILPCLLQEQNGKLQQQQQHLLPEPQTTESRSCSPIDSPKPFVAVNNHYTEQVSTSPEKKFTSEEESHLTNQDRRQEFYLSPISGPVAQPVILPTIISRTSQPFYPTNTTPPLSSNRSFLNNETTTTTNTSIIKTTQNSNNHVIRPNPKKAYFAKQNCSQLNNCQKPEISHPVSRLCDSIIQTNDKIVENNKSSNDGKIDAEGQCSEKLTIATESIGSDSNNNNNEVTNDNIHRGRNNNSEDHRCDQCGKTFVTRASLKVIISVYLCLSLSFFSLT